MREANLTVDDAGFDAMGIRELLALGRDAGIRDFEELACHGTGAVVQVEVETRYDEERLDSLECVDNWEHVAETEGGNLYVIAFTAPELPPALAEEAEDLVGTCDPDISADHAQLSFVGSQETISNAIREYEDAGVAPDLRRLGAYEGRDRPLEALTERQREVLRTAFEVGYFEVPRVASTADVAAELDLDSSTVTEHLQRAERNLLSQFLE